jgi:superfamily II DNA or RNA helicase
MTLELLPLRPYQRDAIDAVTTAWGEGMQRPAVVLPTGMGKGHTARTEVPTPNGLRKWGDLSPGDFVFGADGQPTEVLEVYDRGILPVYRVQFSDGSEVTVDGDHLWQVRDAKYRRTSREVRTLSTAELAAEGLRFGPSHRFRIPMTGAVQYAGAEPLPIDPYTLGALIANGYTAGDGAQLTTPDPEVAKRIAKAHKINKVRDTTEGACDRYSILGLTKPLKELGLKVLARDKHIPRLYLEASVPDRVALLQGLMDGDGQSRTGGRRSVIYHTISRQLADDVVELVTSLGGTAKISWTTRDRNDRKPSTEGRVAILLPSDVEPFHSNRRKQAEQPRRAFEPRRAIVAITPAGHEPVTCIRVAAEDHLYLVTSQHIVTHNTVVFSHLAKEFHARTGRRVLVLVHRDELADQALAKLHNVAPHLELGKVKAETNQVHAQVVVASVQTLAREARLKQLTDAGDIGLVIIDECHHAAADSYQKIMKALGLFNYRAGAAVCVGFTATLARGDGVGLGSTFDDVVFTKSVAYAIKNNFLVAPRGISVAVDGLDTSKVRKSGGDYQAGDLGRALEESDALAQVAEAYVKHAADRPGVVFLPTVATAEAQVAELERVGIKAAAVSGATPTEQRHRIFRDRQEGRIQVLANCMVLTEGFDDPGLSCAVIARPTRSNSLYTQMVGRVLRPFKGKDNALILDMVGASQDNKLITLIDLEEGLFGPQRKPCTTCERTPCECPCETCGGPRPCEECTETSYAAELTLKGTGQEVDLFAQSASAWLQTPKGVWFIPVGSAGEVFLWGRPDGLFDVCHAPLDGYKRKPWVRMHEALPLGTAMSWAEGEAEELDPSISSRGARWRKGKPTDPQVRMAERYKIDTTGMRRGELSDAISVALASRMFDPKAHLQNISR